MENWRTTRTRLDGKARAGEIRDSRVHGLDFKRRETKLEIEGWARKELS